MVAPHKVGTDRMTSSEGRWAKPKRLLELLGIVASTESVECGYHVSGRDWPSEDSGLSFDEVHNALTGIEQSSEAAFASLARTQAPAMDHSEALIEDPPVDPRH